MEWLARAVGVFYAVGGVFVLRAVVMDAFLDRAIAAISMKPVPPDERRQTLILGIGGVLTVMGGLAQATLSLWTLPLVAANIVLQGGYLVWARRALPPEGPEELKGRRSTTNAFFVYAVAAALPAWLAWTGRLEPWAAPAPGALMLAGGAMLAAWLIWRLRPPGSGNALAARSDDGWADGDWADEPAMFEDDAPPPRVLRLAPEYGCWPLWDEETGRNLDPSSLGLPDALTERIERWDARFQASYNPDDPTAPLDDPDDAAAQAGELDAILTALRTAYDGEVVNRR